MSSIATVTNVRPTNDNARRPRRATETKRKEMERRAAFLGLASYAD